MSSGPASSLDAGRRMQPGRREVLFAALALALVGAAAGCIGTDPRANDPESVAVDTTAPRVAAGTFPAVPGYAWLPVPDEEWAPMWTAISSSYHGFVADGQARYVHDAHGDSVGVVLVAWPAQGKGDTAAMTAALDQQSQQAAQHYGTAASRDMFGHEVLEFTDLNHRPNWYWVSGDEFVMVTARDYDAGAAFVANLAARTR